METPAPRKPALPRRIHVLGVCGRLAGGLAIALGKRGCQITGADDRQFGPMPGLVRAAGIPIQEAGNPDVLPDAPAVVLGGGLIEENHPDWQAARARGLEVMNVPVFLEKHLLPGVRTTVVAGTKGKSTTTAMLVWICRSGGLPVDHMVGGQIRAATWPMVAFDGHPAAVLEGDEFPCSPGDPTPKLLRYHARDLVVTNIAHDHPDVFSSPARYRRVFHQAARQLPPGGALLLNADNPGAMACGRLSGLRDVTVASAGFSPRARFRLADFRDTPSGSVFSMDGVSVHLAIPGKVHATNAALAILAAERLGIPRQVSIRALADFPGVAGRGEIRARFGESVFLTEDSNHPLAVEAALADVRRAHPHRRILAILFLSNTGGKSGLVQKSMPRCLRAAHAVLCLYSPAEPDFPGGPFDLKAFLRDLRAMGMDVFTAGDLSGAMDLATGWLRDGDIAIGFKATGPDIPWEKFAARFLAADKPSSPRPGG